MRKKLPKEMKRHQTNVTLPYDVVEYLRTQFNKSLTVEQALKRTKDFKQWEAEQKRLAKEGTQPQPI